MAPGPLGRGVDLFLHALLQALRGLGLALRGLALNLLNGETVFLLSLAADLGGDRGGALLGLCVGALLGLPAQLGLLLTHPNLDLGLEPALGLLLGPLQGRVGVTLEGLGLLGKAGLSLLAGPLLGLSREPVDERVEPALAGLEGRLGTVACLQSLLGLDGRLIDALLRLHLGRGSARLGAPNAVFDLAQRLFPRGGRSLARDAAGVLLSLLAKPAGGIAKLLLSARTQALAHLFKVLLGPFLNRARRCACRLSVALGRLAGLVGLDQPLAVKGSCLPGLGKLGAQAADLAGQLGDRALAGLGDRGADVPGKPASVGCSLSRSRSGLWAIDGAQPGFGRIRLGSLGGRLALWIGCVRHFAPGAADRTGGSGTARAYRRWRTPECGTAHA